MSWEDDENPWAQKGSRNGGNGRKGPQVEEMWRSGQDHLNRMMKGGSGGSSFWGIAVALLLGIWVMNCFYTVREDEQGVVLRFGKWVRTEPPGLNFLFFPIERVLKPAVMRVNQIESNFLRRHDGDPLGNGIPDDNLMLTGDENILDVSFTVLWRINNVRQYLFNTRDPEATIRAAAEAAVREVISQNTRAYAQTEGRADLNKRAQTLLQTLLDSYGMGVEVLELQLQKVDAPAPVTDAFLDVQRARADQERLRNEAEAYRNDIIPKARGEAQQMLEEAEGYKRARILIAEGEAEAYEKVLTAYKNSPAPEVVKERMYQETMQEVFANAKKVIADPKTVTYLPLPGFKPQPEVKQ